MLSKLKGHHKDTQSLFSQAKTWSEKPLLNQLKVQMYLSLNVIAIIYFLYVSDNQRIEKFIIMDLNCLNAEQKEKSLSHKSSKEGVWLPWKESEKNYWGGSGCFELKWCKNNLTYIEKVFLKKHCNSVRKISSLNSKSQHWCCKSQL